MNRRLAIVLACMGLTALAGAVPARAHTRATVMPTAVDSAILRGTVVDEGTGEPLPFAVISIASLGIERFSNDQGQFVLQGLRAGTYRLRVRQLGHSPVEQDVVIAEGAVQVVTVRLPRLMTKLAAMRVSADWTCETPGRPTMRDDTTTAQVFEQIEENAERLKLLAKSYPFLIDMERRTYELLGDGPGRLAHVDTFKVFSSDSKQYQPGKVVVEVRIGRRRESMLKLPTLLDFADRSFQRNHCFIVRGLDDSSGVSLLRVDFKAARKLKSPDVHGSVYLDPTSFTLRRADIQLSQIPKGFPGLRAVTVTTNFVDLRPGLSITGSINGVNEFTITPKTVVTGTLEQQSPLSVMFLKARPDGK
ncbi:MAG: carboxypeptidase-like regulatory domain-containing protein [Gemmatimonadota bacterium]